jgi:hypothetical protein
MTQYRNHAEEIEALRSDTTLYDCGPDIRPDQSARFVQLWEPVSEPPRRSVWLVPSIVAGAAMWGAAFWWLL